MLRKGGITSARPGASGRVLAIALAGLYACEPDVRPNACHFGLDYDVAISGGRRFHAVTLLARKGHALALWSDRSGLYARKLTVRGRPEGAATRLASACPGGLDAITGARSVWVACLQQAERGRGARATLFRFSERLERQGELVLAQAGSISSGISMTKTRDRMLVAWRDATLETEQIRQVTVKGDRLTGPAQVVSSRGIGVGAPYTSAQAGRSLTLWAERWPSDASLRGRIVVFDGRGAPRRVLDLHEPSETTPVLLAKHGTRLLAFRDRRGSRFRTGLYLTALSPDFVPIAGPRRVGRATGPSPARLCPCMGGLISATPRNFSTDLFVSVNWLPWDLGKPLGEQEFFEDDVQITRGAVACMQGHALLLMAERGTSTRRLVHLRAVTFECDWARDMHR